MQSALAHMPDITRRLAGREVAVFLDYDGTLTPIVDRPELALLPDSMGATLTALARRCRVAIVSGRDRADVERLVGLDGLVYAGSHGFDITGPDGSQMRRPEAERHVPALRAAEAELRTRLEGIAGVLIEGKAFAVTVHYRLVDPAEVPGIDAVVTAVAARHAGLRRTGGKKVFELRPDIEWDKGHAVLSLLESLDLDRPEVIPLYIGDDETDEDAFRALKGRGIAILVTAAPPAESQAAYCLADTGEVERFLAALGDMLAPNG